MDFNCPLLNLNLYVNQKLYVIQTVIQMANLTTRKCEALKCPSDKKRWLIFMMETVSILGQPQTKNHGIFKKFINLYWTIASG